MLLGTVSAVLAPGDWTQFNDFMAAIRRWITPWTLGGDSKQRMIENTALVAHFPTINLPSNDKPPTASTLSQSPLACWLVRDSGCCLAFGHGLKGIGRV